MVEGFGIRGRSMRTKLWENTGYTHENMGMAFVEDRWRSLQAMGGLKYLLGILERVELPPGNDYVTPEWVERMLVLPEGPRFFFSQGGTALCLFYATPFDQWPDFQPHEDYLEGAPFPVG